MTRPRLSPAQKRLLVAIDGFCGVRVLVRQHRTRDALVRRGLVYEGFSGWWYTTEAGENLARELRREAKK